MPFDGTDFPPDRPRRPRPGDNAAIVLIILIAATLLVMPISLSAFVDLVRYFRQG